MLHLCYWRIARLDLGQFGLVAHEGQLRKFESCGERVTVNCCSRLVSQTITKGKKMSNSELEFDAEYFVDDLTDEEIIELVEMNEWEPDFENEEF